MTTFHFEGFVSEMRRFVPAQARIMYCQFRGDPNDDIKGKWRARVLSPHTRIDEGANVYFCVSAMQKNARNEFRRRKENFAGGLLLMIDDIGGGKGAKFPLSVLKPLTPTALVETSLDNFQAIYMFDRLVDDMAEFDSLIRAFIERQFLAQDTGMAGVNRVFRPPIGVNGKAKYDGWTVRCAEWTPQARYSVADIAKAFKLTLVRQVRAPIDQSILKANKGDRIEAFIEVRNALRAAGMLKREDEDYAGWIDITCPWTDNHTNAVDNGAAIRVPNIDNAWYGGFRCHHGGCEGKGWAQLTDWLANEQAEFLDRVNANG